MKARIFGMTAIAVGIGILFSATASAADKVKMVVTMGGKDYPFVIELDEVIAPKSCQNFRKLCAEGFYDGTLFHRVIPGYIVQAGDPLSKEPAKRGVWGTGGPGYTVPAELGKPHLKGAIAMARLGNDVNPKKESSGSQFYVALDRIESLDNEYTVFGQVVAGLENLIAIGKAPTDTSNIPLDKIVIKSATVLGNDGAAGAITPAPVSVELSEAPTPAPLEIPPAARMETPAPAPAPAPTRDITPPRTETRPPPSQPSRLSQRPPTQPPPAPAPSAPKPKKKKGGFTKFLERFW